MNTINLTLKTTGLLLLCLFAFSAKTFAQGRQVTGTVVSSEDGEGMPGVSIQIEGTTQGGVTDINGTYSLQVSGDNAVLVFSFIGYETQRVSVGARTLVNVTLATDVTALDEVVVTAFGIEREKRSLGYSVGEVTGKDVSEIKEANMLNNLAGRVAGVNVRSMGADAGSSVNISIRGVTNLTPGAAQPLYVVDGVPLEGRINFNGGSDRNVDYGNGGATDINPEDIENITILKGANASALYGSRAAYGVVLIETKSGKRKQAGMGVDFSSSFMVDHPFLFPEMQTKYGQGMDGIYDPNIGEAWGPKLDVGNTAVQYNSPEDENGNKTPTELKSYPDNAKRFLQDAVTASNTVAVTYNDTKANMRIAFTDMRYRGIIPNTDLERNTLHYGGGFNASDKLRINLSANFTQTRSDNRPVDASSKSNIIQLLLREMPPNIDVEALKDYWVPGKEDVQQYHAFESGTNNPYFVVNENLNGTTRNRLSSNVTVIYDFNDNFSVKGQTMYNYSQNFQEERQAHSSSQFKNGYYSASYNVFQEINSNILLEFHKKVGDWYFSINAGPNFMRQYSESMYGGAGSLVIPGVYSFNNAANTGGNSISVGKGFSEKEIHSVLGLGQIAWNEAVYLDITARNDWSSALPVDNNDYLYLSASLSSIISDLVSLPDQIDLFKVRIGAAEVGKDLGPYMLSQGFFNSGSWNGIQSVSMGFGLPPINIQEERLLSMEGGFDLTILNNRLGLEATYYNTNYKNMIFYNGLSATTGFGGILINAGDIQNRGLEVTVNTVPIDGPLRWNLSTNFSLNRNKILELDPSFGENDFLQLASTRGNKNYAFVGKSTSAVYTRELLRDSVSGLPITANGLYQRKSNDYSAYRGDYNPDFQMGFINALTWKDFGLSFLIDYRQGGIVVDATTAAMANNGLAIETLTGRDAESGGKTYFTPEGETRNDGMVLEGIDKYSGNPNAVIIPSWAYYKVKYDFSTYPEFNTYSATFVKLRQVSLTYMLPQSIIDRLTGIQRATISLQGKNLLWWTKDKLKFDPETAFSSTAGIFVGGVSYVDMPATRSFGLKLNLIL